MKNPVHNIPIHRFIIINLLVIISLFFADNVFSQWVKVDNLPAPYQGEYFLEVYFLESNPDYGWICGYHGAVLRTSDGGNSWLGTTIPGNLQLESINFVSPKVGFTSGVYDGIDEPGAIFKTTDGGATWKDITPVNVIPKLWGNYFVNENVGVVVGEGCQNVQYFYRTTDGGTTWNLFTGDELLSAMCDVILYSEDGLGYASSSGRIWQTLNGGKTWNIFSETGDNDWHEELAHRDNSFLLPYSKRCSGKLNGGMRFSTDMGLSWNDEYFYAKMFGSFLMDPWRGWGCGSDANVHFTSDGGQTWKLMNCGINDTTDLDDIWFINDTTGWLVGQGVFRYVELQTLKPEITAQPKNTICSGDSVIITVEGNYGSYEWSNGETTKSITVTEPGEYWVKVENGDCFKGKSEIITVSTSEEPQITIIAEGEDPLCEGDSLELYLKEDFDYFEWGNGETTESIVVHNSGTYHVTITDSNGCDWTKEIDVEFFPNPKPSISSNGNAPCQGDTVTLTADKGFSEYTWINKNNGKSEKTTSNSYKTTEEGSYYARVINDNGCENFTNDITISFRNDSNRLKITNVSPGNVFNFDSTQYRNLKCLLLTIQNTGPQSYLLDENVTLFKGTGFSIPSSQLPIIIPSGDSIHLEVCYQPTILGEQKDTIRISDICGDQVIPMTGTGVSLVSTSTSKCGSIVRLKINPQPFRASLSLMDPYPNPADKGLTVPFELESNYSDLNLISGTLYNSYGKEIQIAGKTVESLITNHGTKIFKGKFVLNTSQLQQGIYRLMISLGNEFKTYGIVINH